jgi:hypothetical protein
VDSISFAEILVAFVAIAVVVSMLICYRSLRDAKDWPLTDALSKM